MIILFQMIRYLIEHNIGVYEIFFSKDALCFTLSLLFFGFIGYTWDQYLSYSIRMTLYMIILSQMIRYLIESNIGVYEIFFSKDALCYTLSLLFFGSIGYTIDYYYRYKNKKL